MYLSASGSQCDQVWDSSHHSFAFVLHSLCRDTTRYTAGERRGVLVSLLSGHKLESPVNEKSQLRKCLCSINPAHLCGTFSALLIGASGPPPVGTASLGRSTVWLCKDNN